MTRLLTRLLTTTRAALVVGGVALGQHNATCRTANRLWSMAAQAKTSYEAMT